MINSNDIYEKAKVNIGDGLYSDSYKKEMVNEKLKEYTNKKLQELNVYVGENMPLENMLYVLDASITNKDDFFQNYTYYLLRVMENMQNSYIHWYTTNKKIDDSPMIEFSFSGYVHSLISSNKTPPVEITAFTLDTFNNVFLDERIYRSNKILTKYNK